MRLKDVYLICAKYMERMPELDIKKLFMKLEQKYIIVDNASPRKDYLLDFHNSVWEEIVKELEELEKIEGLCPIVNDIKDILFMDGQVKEYYSVDDKGRLMKQFSILSLRMQTIVDLCESFGYSNEEYIGFDIKVPVKNDFSSMTKILSDFNKITQQAPFLNSVDATIQYKKVDLGSTWIEFFIVGTAAITLLNSLSVFIDHCIAILSHKKMCQQQEENLRRMKIANDAIEAMSKVNQDVTGALKDKFISELGEGLGPEEQDRARLCFDMMIELLDQGLEIHQAITKNENNSLLFPTSEKWKEINCNLFNYESIEENQKD